MPVNFEPGRAAGHTASGLFLAVKLTERVVIQVHARNPVSEETPDG
jgi:hypothetical protein